MCASSALLGCSINLQDNIALTFAVVFKFLTDSIMLYQCLPSYVVNHGFNIILC